MTKPKLATKDGITQPSYFRSQHEHLGHTAMAFGYFMRALDEAARATEREKE